MKRKGYVIYKHDPRTPLTPAQKVEFEALEAMPDSEIDLTEIPELDEAFWRNAKPLRRRLSVPLDPEILYWLQSSGPEYQTKLNAILREAMQAEAAKEGH